MRNQKIDIAFDHTGERLLGGKDKKYEFNIFGYLPWRSGDGIIFESMPDFSVREKPTDIIIDGNGNEFSIGEFRFLNLEEAFGTLNRIVVYYETTSLHSPVNTDITLEQLQQKQILFDLPVYTIGDEFYYEHQIQLIEKPTYYNFYAVYLNSENRPAEYNGEPIISYALKIPFYGLSLYHNILEGVDLKIPGLNTGTDIDLDGQGFFQIQPLDSNEVTLSFFDIESIQSREMFIEVFGEYPVFKDTYGYEYNLKYEHLKKFESYVLYMFISDSGKHPEKRFPKALDYTISREPTVKDRNGKWLYIGQYTEPTATVVAPEDSVISFWIGYKFKNV